METLTQVPLIFTEATQLSKESPNFLEPWDKGFTPKDQLAEKYSGSGDPVGSTMDVARSADERFYEIISLAVNALASIQSHEKRIGNK